MSKNIKHPDDRHSISQVLTNGSSITRIGVLVGESVLVGIGVDVSSGVFDGAIVDMLVGECVNVSVGIAVGSVCKALHPLRKNPINNMILDLLEKYLADFPLNTLSGSILISNPLDYYLPANGLELICGG